MAGWWVRTRDTAASVMTPGYRNRGLATATEQAKAGGGWLVITSADGSRGMDGALKFLLRVEYAIATRSR